MGRGLCAKGPSEKNEAVCASRAFTLFPAANDVRLRFNNPQDRPSTTFSSLSMIIACRVKLGQWCSSWYQPESGLGVCIPPQISKRILAGVVHTTDRSSVRQCMNKLMRIAAISVMSKTRPTQMFVKSNFLPVFSAKSCSTATRKCRYSSVVYFVSFLTSFFLFLLMFAILSSSEDETTFCSPCLGTFRVQSSKSSFYGNRKSTLDTQKRILGPTTWTDCFSLS